MLLSHSILGDFGTGKDAKKAFPFKTRNVQGVPKKRGIKNVNFLTQYLGLQTVLRKVFVLKIKL